MYTIYELLHPDVQNKQALPNKAEFSTLKIFDANSDLSKPKYMPTTIENIQL